MVYTERYEVDKTKKIKYFFIVFNVEPLISAIKDTYRDTVQFDVKGYIQGYSTV